MYLFLQEPLIECNLGIILGVLLKVHLLSSFPYTRFTCDEVIDLFKAYNINLECDDLGYVDIVQAL